MKFFVVEGPLQRLSRPLGGNMWGAETYYKKGRPAESAVVQCKKEKVWVTGWSTLFPFYIVKQPIFLSEGA